MNKKRIIPVLIFFVVASLFMLFRFYNIHNRIIFDWDQERDAWQIYDLLINHKPTLIGPRVVDVHGFFLAPYYTYLLLPFYVITRLHPYALILFLATYNMLFLSVGWLIINKMFSYTHALLFFLFWGVNTLLITYDITPWNPLLIPLGVLLTWFLLYKTYKQPKLRYAGLLGFTTCFFINFHIQFIFVTLHVLIGLLLIARHNFHKPISYIKFTSLFIIGFIMPLTPLFLFDIRHDFLNARLFFGFLFSKTPAVGAHYTNWFPVWTNFVKPLIFVESIPFALIIYAAILGIFIYLYKKTTGYYKNFYISSIVLWISIPIAFSLYGKRPSEYYFTFAYVYMFIAIAHIFILHKKEAFALVFAAILLTLNIKNIRFMMQNSSWGLASKINVAKTIQKHVSTRTFNLTYDLELGRDNGYRYILQHYGVGGNGNSSDPLVEIRRPARPGDILIENIGIKIPQDILLR